MIQYSLVTKYLEFDVYFESCLRNLIIYLLFVIGKVHHIWVSLMCYVQFLRRCLHLLNMKTTRTNLILFRVPTLQGKIRWAL